MLATFIGLVDTQLLHADYFASKTRHIYIPDWQMKVWVFSSNIAALQFDFWQVSRSALGWSWLTEYLEHPNQIFLQLILSAKRMKELWRQNGVQPAYLSFSPRLRKIQ